MPFSPQFQISPQIAKSLMQIEGSNKQVDLLPTSPAVLVSLRHTAKLVTTHYSTAIEGNQLEVEEIRKVVELDGHFPGRERDEREVKGYFTALSFLENEVRRKTPISEEMFQTLHALLMSDGRARVRRSPYRDGQNVIHDGGNGRIIYMPPEAKDVPNLMRDLIQWVQKEGDKLPVPILAGIIHYQLATIHPYYDGNGRLARLMTSGILHLGGYDLKGLYSLEEHYAKNLSAYYRAIAIGPSHNYYLGRKESDITGWLEYFCNGVVIAFDKVVSQMRQVKIDGLTDHSILMRTLDPKQRKILTLFHEYQYATTRQIADFFQFQQRSTANLCRKWVSEGFLELRDPSKKNRKYCLHPKYESLLNT